MPRCDSARSLNERTKVVNLEELPSSLLAIICEHRVKRRMVGFYFPFLAVFIFPYFSELHCKPLTFVRDILNVNLSAVQLSKCDYI